MSRLSGIHNQRTFGCNWTTVRNISRHKQSGFKIELFYFLPIGWLDRALAAQKDIRVLKRWWGKKDWEILYGMKPYKRAEAFCKRFESELNYEYVHPWPIYSERSGGRIMYFMIHASDHPEAPKLMQRAYFKVVRDGIKPQEQMSFDFETNSDILKLKLDNERSRDYV